jgi:hypothetical protein
VECSILSGDFCWSWKGVHSFTRIFTFSEGPVYRIFSADVVETVSVTDAKFLRYWLNRADGGNGYSVDNNRDS